MRIPQTSNLDFSIMALCFFCFLTCEIRLNSCKRLFWAAQRRHVLCQPPSRKFGNHLVQVELIIKMSAHYLRESTPLILLDSLWLKALSKYNAFFSMQNYKCFSAEVCDRDRDVIKTWGWNSLWQVTKRNSYSISNWFSNNTLKIRISHIFLYPM